MVKNEGLEIIKRVAKKLEIINEIITKVVV